MKRNMNIGQEAKQGSQLLHHYPGMHDCKEKTEVRGKLMTEIK